MNMGYWTVVFRAVDGALGVTGRCVYFQRASSVVEALEDSGSTNPAE